MAGLPRVLRQVGKAVVKATPILRRHILGSTDYRILSGLEEARRVQASGSGWLSGRAVLRQERAYTQLIAGMMAGNSRVDLRTAAEAVVASGIGYPRLLEVGCGSGYYFEILNELVPGGIDYVGIDYSEPMIARARSRYPEARFDLGDATRLPYDDGAFAIVFNGVSLTHILDYGAVLRESARVASDWCIFNTVPVFSGHKTMFLSKYAYGELVTEVVFEERDLLKAMAAAGLTVTKEWQSIPYDVHEVVGHHSTGKTYLCRVARHATAVQAG
jgi:SAM-dependent methyltransferase